MGYDEQERERELRKRLELLRKQFEAGKMVFAEHLADEARRSLEAVKYGPDGEIDLATVDGRVRAMASAVAAMHHHQSAMEQISLRQVQEEYFRALDSMFGDVFAEMMKIGLTPEQMAEGLHRSDEQVAHTYPLIEEFVSGLEDFWKTASEVVSYHLQELNCIKGVFGGDLFPLSGKNIASTCGLYLDTIILTDPFMNCRELFVRWDERTAARHFIKHGLNVLTYRDLALADVDEPIVVIVPFESAISEQSRDLISSLAEPDALKHAERIFGVSFTDLAELLEFCEKLETPSDVIERVVNPERVLFDTEWTEPLDKQIARSVDEFGAVSGARNAGSSIFAQCMGRMMQATDVLIKSQSLGGTPLIEAPTSWTYFNWKLEYDADLDSYSVPLHMMHGLQRAGSTDVQWLGKIPAADLIELRKTGALAEIREALSKGVSDITDVKPESFFRTADQIVENIESAFEDHRRKMDELKAK